MRVRSSLVSVIVPREDEGLIVSKAGSMADKVTQALLKLPWQYPKVDDKGDLDYRIAMMRDVIFSQDWLDELDLALLERWVESYPAARKVPFHNMPSETAGYVKQLLGLFANPMFLDDKQNRKAMEPVCLIMLKRLRRLRRKLKVARIDDPQFLVPRKSRKSRK
jgi:hypothetical protein